MPARVTDNRFAGSAHFKAREFACPHCGVSLARPALLLRLEQLRRIVGRPIRIVSGYRCPVHNEAVGGARNSQHMYASAADLPERVATPSQAVAAGFTGVGRHGGWAIHVDVRDGSVQQWRE